MKKSKKTVLEIYSDIHLEFGELNYKNNPKSDIVIFAGDLGVGLQGVEWIKKNIPDKPVIYVAGNHEFYDNEIESTYKKIKTETRGTNIHFLQNEKVELNGVSFLGCTLWTDFDLYKRQGLALRNAALYLNDYRVIKHSIGGQTTPIRSDFILDEFNKSLKFLSKNIQEGDVIITHHAPSAKSINKIYAERTTNQYYASNLDGFIVDKGPALWIHGHCHTQNNYKIGKTNIVSNPRGYVGIELFTNEFDGVIKRVNQKL